MKSTKHHVVVVEDDPITRAKLSGYFSEAGYRVSETATAEETRAIISDDSVDLFLIDINLPGEDGLELMRELRNRGDVAIILVTGRTDEVDRVVGLELGADDYVTKPFSARELLARAKNVLRRTAGERPPAHEIVRFDGWTFDVNRRALAAPSGEPVNLTRSEYELLVAFVRHPGEVMARERLMGCIAHRSWQPSDRTIDVLVRRLRRKIEADPSHPALIVTAHGEGYVFTPDVTG